MAANEKNEEEKRETKKKVAPIAAGVAAGVAAGAAGVVAAPAIATAAVGTIGFGPGGIAAGSTAAGMMAAQGGAVATGSIVAAMQSIGATGTLAYLGGGGAAAVAGGVGVVFGLAGFGIYKAVQVGIPAARGIYKQLCAPEWIARLNVTDETRALLVASGIDEAGFAALTLSQLRKMGVATSDQHELLQEITRRRASSTKPPRAAPATTKL